MPCRKRNQELNKKVAKFKRGEPIHVKQVQCCWVNSVGLFLLCFSSVAHCCNACNSFAVTTPLGADHRQEIEGQDAAHRAA